MPNGVACEKTEFDGRTNKHCSKKVLFCGTLSYPPNIDGLNWFAREVFLRVLKTYPDARLLIVERGFNKAAFSAFERSSSIEVVGEVDDLHPWYHECGIAICPLHMGSGTRLKILKSMSFANPVVSTSLGCEGIHARDNESILIRDDPERFADAVNRLLASPSDFDAIR